jgi:WXXGXW repeat (2 copies)
MRTSALVLLAVLCTSAYHSAYGAERCYPPNTSSQNVWVEGQWVSCNGSYSWRPGYWQTVQTTTTVCTTPASQWVEGRWAQGANGPVWIEGHYQTSPTVCTTTPTVVVQQPVQQVVYQQPVVYQPPCRPTTTVVVGAGFGYGYSSYHRPCHNGYGNHHSGVTVVAPVRPVVIAPPALPIVRLPKPHLSGIKLPHLPFTKR